ncbi:ABC transporter permease [Planococcus antarcticus DSM 14505]|uniref:ABC transporter permease n=1 Tax=Planococcus antarcticus DSM 14505 TaxID=1185653 RepID=A0AA87LN95_9BACL|nr:ABC transporter permease [Planococcus antarcticus]EIM05083.1 ABC transporter permease [Planococcus antarcticus DSM 14505]
MSLLQKGWRPVSVLILLLIIWQVLSRVFAIPEWLLPTPTQIGIEAWQSWPDYRSHLFATIQLSIIGLLIGSSIGLGVAICLHLVPKLRETFYPLLILSQNIPIIVLAPLLVIWFGFGLLPKLIIIILVCFFPITIAGLDGFRQTSGELLHYMKMAGATKRQIFWKLEWPHAMPSIFSGLKIAATYSVMGAVISEWLGAQDGIGVYMTLASSSFRTAQVFVTIFLIMGLSLVFFAGIVFWEKRVIRWKTSGGGNADG